LQSIEPKGNLQPQTDQQKSFQLSKCLLLSAAYSSGIRAADPPVTVESNCPLQMPGLAAIPPEVLSRAGVAYVHYVSFMLCFGALVLERRLIKPNPNKADATLMVITDVVYGLAALALLVSGILRVLYFGQGSEFYTENPLFWWKVGLYLGVGGLSLYPTITYILWAIPLRKGELPQVSEALATRLGWILNIELVGFALVPLLATLMARGVGLPA
jgi:putative membrane protein